MEAIKTIELSAQTLAEHPFLRNLTPPHLQFMAAYAAELYFDAGSSILREGDAATHLYLIDRGKVALGTFIPGRGFTTLEVLEDGEALGWSWLIPPYHWHFTAMTILPTWVIAMDGKRLREQGEADHDFGYELLKRLALILGQRLRMARKQLLV
jgi:CRP/FNR family transcriptional regulator, cyclic AMP receptor protein